MTLELRRPIKQMASDELEKHFEGLFSEIAKRRYEVKIENIDYEASSLSFSNDYTRMTISVWRSEDDWEFGINNKQESDLDNAPF